MSDEPDLLQMMNEAAKEAKDGYVETVRDMKANVVNRPLIGKKLGRREATARYREFRQDEGLLGNEYDRLAAQYQLTEEKPIPRRWVDHILRGEKWLDEEEKQDAGAT